MINKTELLQSLLNQVEDLSYDDGNLDIVKKRAEMLSRKIFDNNSGYTNKIKNIRFTPLYGFPGMGPDIYSESFYSGKKKFINLLNVMLEELSLSEDLSHIANNSIQEVSTSNKVFIVHGHNEEMKQAIARFLEKLDLEPIILHEQPNKGRTIIEKFTDYSDVSFAIILLSADDFAYRKNQTIDDGMLRARQNVILELGFFLGKIGRHKVSVLYENVKNFEIPSDYQGVLYTPYDNNGSWRFEIAKELKTVGFNIDINKLI